MRLDKYICQSTSFSREQALVFIEAGQVKVNGTVVTKASSQAHQNNCVSLNNQVLTLRPFRYLLIHKPKDTICSNKDEKYPSVLNTLTIEHVEALHIAGRLDADTTGLVLATDDGSWSFNIITPSKQCEKIYRVSLAKPLAEHIIEQFALGIMLQGELKPTQPAILKMITPTDVRLTLTEGKYHQVKRMFAAVGNKVVTLHREQIGNVVLDVPLGQWRHLHEDEIASFTARPL